MPTRTYVRQLISKLVSGGLSAAVVLLWWPHFFATDSVASWLSRGAVWTLLFELLLHSISPLEAALWETARGRRLRRRAVQAARRLPARASVSHIGGLAFVAAVAVSVPVALMVAAPAHRAQPNAVAVVRHITEIQRVERVERVTPVSAPASPRSPGAATPASASPGTAAVSARPPARRTAAQRRAQPPTRSPQTGTAVRASKPAPAKAQPVASDSTL